MRSILPRSPRIEIQPAVTLDDGAGMTGLERGRL